MKQLLEQRYNNNNFIKILCRLLVESCIMCIFIYI